MNNTDTLRESKPMTNPSYNQNLSPKDRLRDFMGAYHIDLNGVVPHEPFDLKYEGKPGVRCDEDSKQRIIEFVELIIQQEKSQLVEEIKPVMLKVFKSYTDKTFEKTMLGKTSAFDVSDQDWEDSSFTMEEYADKVISNLSSPVLPEEKDSK